MAHCVIRWKRNTRTRLQSEVLQAEEDCFLLTFIETLPPDYAIIIYIIKLKKLNLFFYLKTLVSSGQLCGKSRELNTSQNKQERAIFFIIKIDQNYFQLKTKQSLCLLPQDLQCVPLSLLKLYHQLPFEPAFSKDMRKDLLSKFWPLW